MTENEATVLTTRPLKRLPLALILPHCLFALKYQRSDDFLNPVKVNQSKNDFAFLFLKNGHSRPLFLYFCIFNTQLTVNKCSIYK